VLDQVFDGVMRRPGRFPLPLLLCLLTACGGAAEGTSSPASTCPITTVPSHPTFSADIHPFLQSTCGSSTSTCHGGALASGHVDYSTSPTRTVRDVYADLVGAPVANAPTGFLRVTAFDPGRSWIVSKVTQTQPGGAGYGARMPLGRPDLCATTVDAIVAWVSAGAPF
jgi:hypothetical protein